MTEGIFDWWASRLAQRGPFTCCRCFDELPVEQAWTDETGQRWALCPRCGSYEARWAAMTEEERRAEIRSCDEYVADVERRRLMGEPE